MLFVVSMYITKTNRQMSTFKLSVTETKNKAGKFLYQVIDQDGRLVSERRSNRVYVACTVTGSHYFGRVDLIGKGDHGRMLKYWKEEGISENNSIAYL